MRDTVLHLYEHSRRQLRAVAARYAGDEADDVVQDAFLNALRSGNRFRGDAAPMTWLHRIVVNASLNHCRRRKRWESVHLNRTHRPAPARASFAESLAMRTALRRLTPDQYRVFVMYDVIGHTHNEIARRLAIPQGTSKSRLSDARKRLREAFRESTPVRRRRGVRL